MKFMCWAVFSFSPVTAGAISSLNHEMFTQSNRPAALVIVGIIRWLLFSLVTMIFPFLIVSTEHHRIHDTKKNNINRTSSQRWLAHADHISYPRMPWARTASCCSPACPCWALFTPSSSCPRPKGRACWRSPRRSKPSPCAGNLSRRRRMWRPSCEAAQIEKGAALTGK